MLAFAGDTAEADRPATTSHLSEKQGIRELLGPRPDPSLQPFLEVHLDSLYPEPFCFSFVQVPFVRTGKEAIHWHSEFP